MNFMQKNYRLKKYHWQGLTHEGFKANGIILAPSKNLAKATLLKQNITNISSLSTYSIITSYKYTKISPRILAVFMRQLATLISTGIPLIQSCDILQRAKHSKALNYILSTLKLDLLAGKSFVSSLAKFPEYFNPFICALIQAGVQSGTFAAMLNRIANCKEQNEILKRKIKQALLYPCIILVVAGIVCLILLIIVIPRFVTLFENMQSELPFLTRWVIHLSDLVRMNASWISIGIITLYTLRKKILKSYMSKLIIWRYRLPVIGSLILKNKMMHFARNLATTTSAGLSMLEALSLTAPTIDDKMYSSIINDIIQALKKGCAFHEALTHHHFPHLLIQMTKIGEESGNLPEMLDRVADMYENDIGYFFNNLSQFLEPLIMILLGVLIGGLVIAMYLPIFKLGTIM